MRPIIIINTHPIQYFSPLYKYLTQRGFDLEVWYCSDKSIRGERDQEFNTNIVWDIPLLEGFKYRFFPNKSAGYFERRGGFTGYYNPDLLKALKAAPPSIVWVTAWSYLTAIWVLLKAKSWGHVLLFRGETNLTHEEQRQPWQRKLRQSVLSYLLGNVSGLLYIGRESHAFYQQLRLPNAAFYFCPYAVDNASFQQQSLRYPRHAAREKLGFPAEPRIILFSGKYISKKRPLDLLEAFARQNNPNALLVMMGEGELRGEMEAFILTHGLQKQVILTGFINQAAVPLYYIAANMLVMCSGIGETWGLSVNEAMNFSLPLILSHLTGCQKDLLWQGKNGFVYPCADIDAMQQLLHYLLTCDAATLSQMGEAALERVNQYGFLQVETGLAAALADLAMPSTAPPTHQ